MRDGRIRLLAVPPRAEEEDLPLFFQHELLAGHFSVVWRKTRKSKREKTGGRVMCAGKRRKRRQVSMTKRQQLGADGSETRHNKKKRIKKGQKMQQKED